VLVKDVENRVRNIAGSYTGPVAIHAALAYDDAAFHANGVLSGWWDWYDGPSMYGTRGHIIGVVDLVDVHRGHNTETDQFKAVRSCYQAGKPFGPCSPWAEPDAWHLELASPRNLGEPIPYTGALGLRRLDADTIARIQEQLA